MNQPRPGIAQIDSQIGVVVFWFAGSQAARIGIPAASRGGVEVTLGCLINLSVLEQMRFKAVSAAVDFGIE